MNTNNYFKVVTYELYPRSEMKVPTVRVEGLFFFDDTDARGAQSAYDAATVKLDSVRAIIGGNKFKTARLSLYRGPKALDVHITEHGKNNTDALRALKIRKDVAA